VYDPAIIGKKAVTQGNAGQGDRNVGNNSAGQNPPARQGVIAFDGAKLTGERVFDVGASSSVPGNGARKLVGGSIMNSARELVGV
jgi:hypothetical protein